MYKNRPTLSPLRLVGVLCVALLFVTACSSTDSDQADTSAESTTQAEPTPAETSEATETHAEEEVESAEPDNEPDADPDPEPPITDETQTADTASSCEEIAAQFVNRASTNPDLDDPVVSATCEGDTIVVTSNGIPDYTYIETSPGHPTAIDLTFTIPATPTVAENPTAIPLLGTAAVALNGIPIYGPTEGTGGDVLSLPGGLSDCGSHMGPSGFHIHLILTSSETDCLFTPEEVAAEPQLVGYALDGFPIYTGADQYTSSWELTDESLFATDTWAAHTYVEGSGDLDECNGRTDEDGNYAYYTTATFPYVIGCYTGVVEIDAAPAGQGQGGGDEPEGDRPAQGEDRPERPEQDAAPPEDGEGE